ncbi:MAG: DNA-directed RNA polymerase I subunit RPA1, partial [Paramarteilia canceri]
SQSFSDICETCSQKTDNCPGHYGLITLPLPVYNPLLFGQFLMILKSICMSCNKFNIHNAMIEKFLFSLKKNNTNKETSQYEDTSISSTPFITDEPESDTESVDMTFERTLEAEQSFFQLDSTQNELVSSFLKEVLRSRQGKRCVHCSQPGYTVVAQPGLKIILKAKRWQINSKIAKNKKVKNELYLSDKKILTPLRAKIIFRELWNNNKSLLSAIFPSIESHSVSFEFPTDIFFIEKILASPPRFRPFSAKSDGMIQENQRTILLSRVVKEAKSLEKLLLQESKTFSNDETNISFSSDNRSLLSENWFNLQNKINALYDSDKDITSSIAKINGAKQILEKKEGLFRMNMMGKRVNFSIRSVISPDPLINVDEVGIPEKIAIKITFAERLNSLNRNILCEKILNGPYIHPGALFIENKKGFKQHLPVDYNQRLRIVQQIRSGVSDCVIVHRHLDDTDILYMNRQPTLHRPSIQGHKVRILPGQKTIRIQYSCCGPYNADFDGDEMNGHLCQNLLAKAESRYVASVASSYIVAKNGAPVSGLIQDHIVSAAHLSDRGQIFDKKQYFDLVINGFIEKNCKSKQINLLPPALISNGKMFWTGKQVFSTILINVVLSFSIKLPSHSYPSKIPQKEFQSRCKSLFYDEMMCDSLVVFEDGQLVRGSIDKSSVGASNFGIIHFCNELYGGECAMLLMSCVAHLLTHFLKCRGFTFGIEDLYLTKTSEMIRKKAVKDLDLNARKFITLKGEANELKKKTFMLQEAFQSTFSKHPQSKSWETGPLKKFPTNNMEIMIISGSKGTIVNALQISQNIGQLELEGKRIESNAFGKTFPSFLKNDINPRAYGFVTDRFLTGLRPQEYFMHCMAGREGLVDTSIKTSRTGYLQRCLVKTLE